jgi:hypothetical protein
LSFPPGELFSSQPRTERIYQLFFGPGYTEVDLREKIQELRARTTGILSTIFSTCLARVETFVSVQNSVLGWEVVAGDLKESHGSSLAGPEVEELVRVYADARGAYVRAAGERGVDHTSDDADGLIALIDQWLDATGHGQDHWKPLGLGSWLGSICKTGREFPSNPLTTKTGPPSTLPRPTPSC